MTFSILHTSARPGKWKEVYNAWIAAADNPSNVEYVLCADKRWGFTEKEEEWPNGFMDLERFGGHKDKLVWNTERKCYVDGVNLAAKYATGDVFIVNADDQYPALHWDTLMEQAITSQAGDESRFVVWVNTGTPHEVERRIMPMPIVSRERYHSLGYLLYPGYESMYSDNDLCEHAIQDESNGECVIVRMDRSILFPHRHPYFDSTVQMDGAYAAQNRQTAYNLGQQLFMARRANGFKEVDIATHTAIATTAPIPRRRIALCVSGETFSAAWVNAWTTLISTIGQYHHAIVIQFNSSNVYQTRIVAAREALAITPPVDYMLSIDDDNLVTLANVLQLITDLEYAPHAAMVAGWTLIGTPFVHTERKISCGALANDNTTIPIPEEEFLGPECADFHRVDYTGFPVVLFRRSLLEAMTPLAFSPLIRTDTGVDGGGFDFSGEDVSFCSRAIDKGFQIYVDRRVAVPHLKLRDILTLPAGGVKFNTATVPAPPSKAPKLPRMDAKDEDIVPVFACPAAV
jgi:hypothetical protein